MSNEIVFFLLVLFLLFLFAVNVKMVITGNWKWYRDGLFSVLVVVFFFILLLDISNRIF
jgi:hypothetical protein